VLTYYCMSKPVVTHFTTDKVPIFVAENPINAMTETEANSAS